MQREESQGESERRTRSLKCKRLWCSEFSEDAAADGKDGHAAAEIVDAGITEGIPEGSSVYLSFSDIRRQTILTGNIWGLYTRNSKHKLKMIHEMAVDSRAWMVGLTESHLSQEIVDGEVAMAGYEMFRVDRTAGTRGGGVIVYLRDDVARMSGYFRGESMGYVEFLVFYIEKINVIFSIIYRLEGHPEQFYEVLQRLDSYIASFGEPCPNIVITGDFNFPNIDWKTLKVKGDSKSREEKEQALRLLSFMESHCLEQHMKEPTRGPNILDLILTNNEEVLYSCRGEDSELTDHRLIYIQTAFEIDGDSCVGARRFGLGALNFFDLRIAWDSMEEELHHVHWEDILQHKTPDEIYSTMIDVLNQTCNRYVPKKKSKRKEVIPKDRRLLMRKRRLRSKRLMKAFCPRLKKKLMKEIVNIDEKLKESIKRELENEERKAVSVIKENPKYFYSYARSKSKTRAVIGPLERDGHLIGDPEGMAQMLQDQYVRAFSNPKFTSVRDILNQGMIESSGLNTVNFTRFDVEKAMSELSPSAASGPDGVPSVLLSRCRKPLSRAIYSLWCESLKIGIIPGQLKEATITPIYKGDGKGHPKNYRPVSLTSHIIKIFERIVAKTIVEYLEENNKMNPHQHGFRKNRSCFTQLVQHYYSVLRMIEGGQRADVVYLDFAKAFDKVDHGVLLNKLVQLGVNGQIFKWLHEFLLGRTQVVTVSGAESRPETVLSGVPQGTVLGPVLFLIHVLDIDKYVASSTVTSFADDTRVLKSISTDEDRNALQRDLEGVYRWAEVNNMVFNSTKFEYIQYSEGRVEEGEVLEYKAPEDTNIDKISEVKDLGVILSDDLGFESHIAAAVATARSKMGWVLRTFRTRERNHMLTLYKSLILPHIEYCCQLWSPRELGEIRKIEAVQRTFTHKIDGMKDLNYWERLSALGLYSLERRRERYMIIYVWKMISGFAPMITDLAGEGLEVVQNPKRGRLIEVPPSNYRARANVKNSIKRSIMVHGARLFNKMPAELREVVTLKRFKRELDRFLLSVPDKPSLPHYYQLAIGSSIVEQMQ